MNAGKTPFAQVMEFVPWKTFGRIVAKHKGDSGVRTLGWKGVDGTGRYWSLCNCGPVSQQKLLGERPVLSTPFVALAPGLFV